MPSMRIYLGADHAGLETKNAIAEHLSAAGHEVVDCGAHVYDAEDDYPAFCIDAARKVVDDAGSLGIVLGGSGNGEQIAANKVPGARCALAWSVETARLAREHNNAQLIGIGGRMHSREEACRGSVPGCSPHGAGRPPSPLGTISACRPSAVAPAHGPAAGSTPARRTGRVKPSCGLEGKHARSQRMDCTPLASLGCRRRCATTNVRPPHAAPAHLPQAGQWAQREPREQASAGPAPTHGQEVRQWRTSTPATGTPSSCAATGSTVRAR